MTELTPYQQSLSDYMSEVSLDAYDDYWADGVEYALWHLVQYGPIRYGNLELTETHRATVIALSTLCQGWFHWPNENGERSFVPIDDWKRIYARTFRALGSNHSMSLLSILNRVNWLQRKALGGDMHNEERINLYREGMYQLAADVGAELVRDKE